ncbi:hypothetical protein CVT26_003263 [Gymnopilus dilepis]|uniref:DUF6830 domain-containing protein n=1 Tax=Gymnopilus dilepis TaxID=231916 RepID=A0A409Y521_9AGAR|nr:hypothetical protein CVT26_003263 [Gymnopilus dilepis]
MNQPFGTCHTYYEETIRINTAAAALAKSNKSKCPVQQQDISDQFSCDVEALGDDQPQDSSAMDVDVDHTNAGNNSAPMPTSTQPTSLKQDEFFREDFPGASQTFGAGPTFMDLFDRDKFASERAEQPYYPFASQEEWELAAFLLRSNLSMAAIEKFLDLKLIQNLGLSFHSAKDLCNRAEMLPTGPAWKSMPITPLYPTKNPLTLFFRDPLECLQALLHNPLLKDSLQLTPFRLYESAGKVMRFFTEWLSGDAAWSMQEKLPEGATLLGTILSSDKTNISAMTGNRVAHPLLISLANIDMEFRNKSSHHLFLLLALFPIARFLHPNQKIRGVLEARLFHQNLDIILAPLKKAAEVGVLMNDPLGWKRFCFPPLAAYIVDTPESALISGVAGKTSSVTMASYEQFGDDFRHEARTASKTLTQLLQIETTVDPWELGTYVAEAMNYRLNGVHRPFWRDFPLSDPSIFLTSEPLHHWHKQFFDHDCKWCVNAVGPAEIDFRFSVLHWHIGYRHFKEGISKLKQVTGREQRDIQRYIVAVISQAVSPEFLVAIRSLINFRYLAQSKVVDEGTCRRIENALRQFHDNKQAILDAGARRGKSGPINHWQIPKLEFFQSVVPNIRLNGVAIQWSADTTEHAHIEVVKEPARASNNQNYESQICRDLDRSGKMRDFELATTIRAAKLDFRHTAPTGQGSNASEAEADLTSVNTTGGLLAHLGTTSLLSGSTRQEVDYFTMASQLRSQVSPDLPRPYRTRQSSPFTAFHLTRDPTSKCMSIDQVAALFQLPDLRPALGDYILRLKQARPDGKLLTVGGRRISNEQTMLPFSEVSVWNSFRLQNKAYHSPHDVLPGQTINAHPPNKDWPHGRYDTVIANTSGSEEWPKSGLKGESYLSVERKISF